MPTKTAALTLAFAVAFLAAANVNAGMVTTQHPDPDGTLTKLFTVQFSGSSYSTDGVVAKDTEGTVLPASDPTGSWIFSVPGTISYFEITGNAGPVLNLNIDGQPFATEWVNFWAENPLSAGYPVYSSSDFTFDSIAGVSVSLNSPTPFTNFALTFYGDASDSDEGAEGVAAPEPATLAVLGLGLAGLGLVSRRRRK